MLERIFIVRHGFRSTWVTDSLGNYSSVIVSPTGIPTDPPLASHGVSQAHQLSTHLSSLPSSTRPERIYSSPYYRCLQTIAPVADALNLSVHLENGIGEWFGLAPFVHPGPASTEVLHKFFPRVVEGGRDVVFVPRDTGETFEEVHERCAYVLARMIEEIDGEWKESGTGVRNVLLCGHAASVIAMGRALVGDMELDVRAGTASCSEYVRREGWDRVVHKPVPRVAPGGGEEEVGSYVPNVGWRGGVGVGGGWDMVKNGDCSFLEGGEERNWWFTGDEAWGFPGAKVVGTVEEKEKLEAEMKLKEAQPFGGGPGTQPVPGKIEDLEKKARSSPEKELARM